MSKSRRSVTSLLSVAVSVGAVGIVNSGFDQRAGAAAPKKDHAIVRLDAAYRPIIAVERAFDDQEGSCGQSVDLSACEVAADQTAAQQLQSFIDAEEHIAMPAFASPARSQLVLEALRSVSDLQSLEQSAGQSQLDSLLMTTLTPDLIEFAQNYQSLVFLLGNPSSSSQASEGVKSRALLAAQQIALQPSDFPAGTSVGTRSFRVLGTPSPPSLCAPVSSQPWLADVLSDSFTIEGSTDPTYSDAASSNVVIMPSSRRALAGLRATGVSGYGSVCIRQAYNVNSVTGYPPNGECVSLSLVNSTITATTAAGFLPHSVVHRYVATLRCSGDGATHVIVTDIVSEAVGRVFIQGVFDGVGTPVSGGTEQTVMSAMDNRVATALG